VKRTHPPLQVLGFIATRRGDPERGPQIRLNTEEATLRLVEDGALIWVYGPRRHELAVAVYDESVPKGGVVVRDLAGLAVTEIVRLVRTDADRPILQTPHRSVR
jgi:hypothetical protein